MSKTTDMAIDALNKKMVKHLKFNVSEARVTELHNLYSMWLMDYCPEEIGCKDHLIELEENQVYSEEFLEWVEENV